MKRITSVLFICLLTMAGCVQKNKLLTSLVSKKNSISDSIKYYSNLSDSYILKSQNDPDEELTDAYRDTSIMYFDKYFALQKKLKPVISSIDSLEKVK